jgi:hypothetical protein
MTGTRRTPIGRQRTPQISEKAIKLFHQMRRCRGSDRWWTLQNDLCDELRTPVWQYPCIEDPRDADGDGDRPEAQALWRALDQAARELRRQEREARKAAEPKQPPDQPTPDAPPRPRFRSPTPSSSS